MTVVDARPSRGAKVFAVLPLLWHGRLSWLRIVLVFMFSQRTLELVRGWHTPVPDAEYQGWVLGIVPAGLRDFVLAHPNPVAAGVLLLTVLSVVGLATRPALLCLVLVGLFARAVEVSQGVFDHESSLTTQVLFVLVFAPGTNTISLEHLIRWWRAGRKDLLGYLTRPFRQWGVYLILGLLAVTYTTSGLSKLRFSDFRWFDGETLGFYLRGLTSGDEVYVVGGGQATWRDDFGLEMYTYGNYNYGSYHPAALTGIVDWMAHTPAIMIAVSVATLLLELGGLLLFVPRLRSLMLIGYICMHTTIGVLMGLPFLEYQVICLLFIEWERIVPFIQKRFAVRRSRKHEQSPGGDVPPRAATGEPARAPQPAMGNTNG
ncbi:hypothetical protein [Microbacterium sp. CPCC 204701]|uniref:hypothetical protein n=1 Tax=Microbacterium sp. CPCC 204701 TaxID=2493084 RepID=UPI000FD6EF30|nr:hypothetical protein [Microbacterium sp. CPCC 204701]